MRKIDKEILVLVDNAEQYLAEMGFAGCRVRVGGNITIIEIQAKDIERLAETTMRNLVQEHFLSLGLGAVALSLRGR